MLALNYVHHGEARLVCEAHEEWGRSFQALHPPLPPLTLDDVDAADGRPLVVSWQGGCAHGAWVLQAPVPISGFPGDSACCLPSRSPVSFAYGPFLAGGLRVARPVHPLGVVLCGGAAGAPQQHARAPHRVLMCAQGGEVGRYILFVAESEAAWVAWRMGSFLCVLYLCAKGGWDLRFPMAQ